MSDAIVTPRGFSHIRLTLTDIHLSKAFYEQLFGMPPGSDFSDQIDDPAVRDDPDPDLRRLFTAPRPKAVQ